MEFSDWYGGVSTLPRERGPGLATAGGREAHPHFFSGWVGHGPQTARALLTAAMTSNVEILRFESFPSCNGVHTRFDLDADSFTAGHVNWGCTNVDANRSCRRARPPTSSRASSHGHGAGTS